MAAMNIELRYRQFLVFADAGTVYDSSAHRDLFSDAGVGLSLAPRIDGDTSLFTLGFYVPFYVNDPSRPGDKEFSWRWKVVVGVRI